VTWTSGRAEKLTKKSPKSHNSSVYKSGRPPPEALLGLGQGGGDFLWGAVLVMNREVGHMLLLCLVRVSYPDYATIEHIRTGRASTVLNGPDIGGDVRPL
jgi:hypothetical protein